MSGLTIKLANGQDFWMKMAIPDAEAVGVLVLVITSSVSALAVLLLLSAIFISSWNTRKSSNPNLFVRSHAAGYLISLLLCDLCQATGSLMNARWYVKKSVEFEPFCIAQGAIKQLSDVGIAIWATVIACHTFWVLFLRWPLRRYVMIAALVFSWSTIASLVITGPATLNVKVNGPFFGISGYWCWISSQYPVSRVTLDYMFMFISVAFSAILYILIFLRLRGNILLKGSRIRFRTHHRTDVKNGLSADSHTINIAKQMLLYPFAYAALLLPIAICRFMDWSGHDVPFAATIFSDTVYLLSGLVNVLLFIFTRRVLPRHSIITKRFRKEPSLPQIPSSAATDVPLGPYMSEKLAEDGIEDEKVFMRVDSPDDGEDIMIPVHLVSSFTATPVSPVGHSPTSVRTSVEGGEHVGERVAFPANVASLMTYPQSPVFTQISRRP